MSTSTDQMVMELKKTNTDMANNALSSKQFEQPTELSHLINALQTTLDLNKLLIIFDTAMSKTIGQSGFIFENNEFNATLQHGLTAHHKCEYNLTIESTFLGKLTFMRRKRFTEEELQLIEHLLTALLYPLKNALLYLQALRSSYTDPLTGALNRSTLDSVFQKEVSLTKRHHSNLSLFILDVDFFKVINDTYGHAAGDMVLKSITRCIQETVRESDHVFRIGGEEFAVLLNSTDSVDAEILTERLRKAAQALPIKHADHQFNITVSIGIAQYNEGDTLDNLMEEADKALYQAKNTGRNKTVCA
ncbi:MAG: GGDEF domain-containing protein [Cycloclasticus sp.]